MLKSKSITLTLLIFFMVSVFCGTGIAPVGAATIPSDIAGSWAFRQISDLVERGAVSGYPDGLFRPNNPVTRAEFIAMINRAFAFRESAAISYSDVQVGAWYYDDIAKASQAGYVTGFTDGTMRPGSYISRQEAAAMVARGSGLDVAQTEVIPFSDSATIPSWSRNYIAAMVEAGYLSGYPDGTFKPFISISRSEAAAIIFQSMGTRVAGVTLNRSTATLTEGRTLTLLATVTPGTAVNQSVTWTSSNPAIATVNSSGKVIARRSGTVDITVTTAEGAYTDTCRINVVSRKTNLDMPASLDLYLDGNTEKTMIIYLDGTDSEIDAMNVEVRGDRVIRLDYDFDDTFVTISAAGTDEGQCQINLTVFTDDGGKYEADCDVTVHAEAIEAQLVMPELLNLYIGGNDDKTMMIYLDGADSSIDEIAWAATGADIFDVDYHYGARYVGFTVDGDKIGESTLSLTVNTVQGEKYQADCHVMVADVDDFGEGRRDFDFSDTFVTMDTDDKVNIKAYIPDGYDTKDVNEIEWDSDDTTVADIKAFDDSEADYITLTVESDEEGDCTIIVYLTIGEDLYRADLGVTVESSDGGEDLTIYDDDLTLSPNEEDTVRVYLPMGYNMDDVGDISWASDDAEVADVIDYDYEDEDRYVTFTVKAYENGSSTINFVLEVAGDELDADLFVTVKD